LLEGNAARAIKGLTLTGANYDAAVKILQERFGKTQQSISAHMDEILKFKLVRAIEQLGQLRYVYDKISVHVRGLATLGVSSEQYGSMLIPS
jgi:DNA-binding transcriptional ArsR family regulator